MSLEPVVQLANKYYSEFQETFKGLRQRSVKLSDDAQQQLKLLQQQAQVLEPMARQKKEEFQHVLSDMSPLEGFKTQSFLETFAWTSILEIAAAITSTLSSFFIAHFIGLFLDTFWAIVLAYSLLPFFAFKHVQIRGTDNETRFKLLIFAGVEGLLNGFLIQERYLPSIQPFSFITPMAIGVVAQLAEGKLNGQRNTFLGATLGAGAAAHLLFGLLLDALSFPYFLLTFLYTAIGFVAIQVYFKFQANNDSPTHLYQLAFFVVSFFAQGLTFLLFGGPYEAPLQ